MRPSSCSSFCFPRSRCEPRRALITRPVRLSPSTSRSSAPCLRRRLRKFAPYFQSRGGRARPPAPGGGDAAAPLSLLGPSAFWRDPRLSVALRGLIFGRLWLDNTARFRRPSRHERARAAAICGDLVASCRALSPISGATPRATRSSDFALVAGASARREARRDSRRQHDAFRACSDDRNVREDLAMRAADPVLFDRRFDASPPFPPSVILNGDTVIEPGRYVTTHLHRRPVSESTPYSWRR